MTEVFVASKEKPKNGYGQNGYQGASSALPGQKVTSGFLPEVKLPDGVTAKVNEGANWQTRAVDAAQYPASHGMKARNDKIDFPTANVRPASKRAAGGNYQR